MTINYVKSSILRWILICCGWFFVVAGITGVFLPLLPTVPFLLLAAACFARSSERFHGWLVNHVHLGPLVRDYLNDGKIPLRVKRMAIGMVLVSIPSSAYLFVPFVWMQLVLIIIAVVITLYLLRLPTTYPEKMDIFR